MTFPPESARVVLIDGPVALYLHYAPEAEIEASLLNVIKLAAVAVEEFEKERQCKSDRPAQPPLA
jgi:hypothetical protein